MRVLALAACAVLLPAAAGAATRSFEVDAFDKVSVASGIDVDIVAGSMRSVVAETRADDFDDLRVEVRGNELRISRPARFWSWWRRRPDYQVRVVMPQLRSLDVSSGAEVTVKGAFSGDFAVESSSGSEVDVAQMQGGTVRARSSSGSELRLAGSCQSLDADSSSGSDLDAGGMMCGSVTVEASSGSSARVAATRELNARASSGADVKVNGAPAMVKVSESSGGNVDVQQVNLQQVEK